MIDDIYKLKLHDNWILPHNEGTVLRVPGGWLYSRHNPSTGELDPAIFVPFDNEFMKEKESI